MLNFSVEFNQISCGGINFDEDYESIKQLYVTPQFKDEVSRWQKSTHEIVGYVNKHVLITSYVHENYKMKINSIKVQVLCICTLLHRAFKIFQCFFFFYFVVFYIFLNTFSKFLLNQYSFTTKFFFKECKIELLTLLCIFKK